MPLMATIEPEKDERDRTIMSASIKYRKSTKALIAVVFGFLLNSVWLSSSVIPRSRKPERTPRSVELAEQLRAITLLSKIKQTQKATSAG